MPAPDAAPVAGDDDVSLLLEAARAAGEIALRHFRAGPKAVEKPGGLGPVTEADLEVDRMLRETLRAARPDYGWLSEESVDGPERLAAGRVFIVDPIDGTRAFASGQRAWAHSLAVAERGRIVAGVVHLPLLERSYRAAAGSGAWMNDAPITASPRTDLDDARVLATAAQLDPRHWRGGAAPRLERHMRPSLAYRLCLAAEGRFDAMLTFRDCWEWDVAAGDLIAREAGATVTTRAGAAAVYNNPRPLVAGMIVAGPALHAALLARIT
ncbi:3'(2'),5'-bisphosphate nucleotidase CysQ [Amaricoccus sp.]|uniref:inositol monophosphatase family protein n=1 Tax=Amaricoccus sp. TaxID=1872485 RepID=UPI001B400F89|nr:3'(2'),5'-bisphosphate nucleotidase CysQ [Amaricoccus sp.]MBP7242992.1 3'(2'),5'-bisphosphate nucleotidase CysQ [Amaricoccus sp.]